MRRPPSFFKYVLGSFVQVGRGAPVQRVIWRGKLLMPSSSDWLGEIAVYRLDNEYWDCYYEYQLLPAQPWDNDASGHQLGS